jgi:hypothetical protein
MNRKQNRRQLPTSHTSEATPPTPDFTQVMPYITRVMNVDVSERAAWGEGEPAGAHDDPEHSAILLAACRIVAGGYKAEISRGQADSLLVQAAYQLLRHFLERQFAPPSRAA